MDSPRANPPHAPGGHPAHRRRSAQSPPLLPPSPSPPASHCNSAPGSPRWSRGAPPTTASSPLKSWSGTAASPTASPAPSSSRPPASARSRAGPLLRIGHDRFIPGLRDLARTVRERSSGKTPLHPDHRFSPHPPPPLARALPRGILADHTPPPRAPRQRTRRSCLAPRRRSRGPHTPARPRRDSLLRVLTKREADDLLWGARERVTDTHLPHIRDLPRTLPALFSAAARRAREAGFDGVELHYAHAYTMASFLSALNTRADGYGGPREDRARLPLEVFAAVREAVGKDFTVGCRFLCDDVVEGGNRPADAAFFGVAFARAGMDFLSLSTGGKFEDSKQPKVGEAAYPYTGQSGYECMPTVISDARGPFLRNVAKQAEVRRAVRDAGLLTPVVAAGGIGTFREAESILAAEQADLVAAARQSLADPDWWKKVRLGQGSFVRRCTYTNYCEALDQKHKIVTCQLWDRQALDAPGIRLTPDGKRRLTAPPHDFDNPSPPLASRSTAPAGRQPS
ncbi:MAG: NADH:flavin oxidoreductase [Polyangiaceae bacterium]